ncbi:MAG: MarR family transcriptional regulator [Burkholderiaceae bacterium]
MPSSTAVNARASKSASGKKPAGKNSTRKTGAAGAIGKPPHFYRAEAYSLCQENNVGHLLKRTTASLTRMIDQGVVPLGLTAMQWKPLVMICHGNLDTPAELSRKAMIDTGAMTRTLDRLETKGFLTRHRCEEDRRVVKLELTDSGRQVADGILPIVANSVNTHLDGFSHDEVVLLLDFLHRMISNGANPDDANARDDP